MNPKYYRHEGRCIKRISDTKTIEIQIPAPGNNLPLSHQHGTYPSKKRLDEDIEGMEQVDQDIYEAYLADFFQGAERNRTSFNEIRQQRHNSLPRPPAPPPSPSPE
jgi:hypothetical protein